MPSGTSNALLAGAKRVKGREVFMRVVLEGSPAKSTRALRMVRLAGASWSYMERLVVEGGWGGVWEKGGLCGGIGFRDGRGGKKADLAAGKMML